MEHCVYLKSICWETSVYIGQVLDHFCADIMYINEDYEDEYDDEYFKWKGRKIGFINWRNHTQDSAMKGAVCVPQCGDPTSPYYNQALAELAFANITRETIDEVGAASNPMIMQITDFGIETAWRKKGIGEQVLKMLIQLIKGKYGYLVILNSEPQQFSDNPYSHFNYEKNKVGLAGLEKDAEKAQYKLNAFWQRCGLRQFKNYDNVFICNIDQAVPELSFVPPSVSRSK